MEKNMSKPGLEPGIKGEKEMVVGDKHLASALGSGLVDVFATAMMIAGMEEVCVASVQPYLEPGTTTVGVGVDVSHCAATPAGMKVDFESELSEISQNGKGLLFRVEARDEAGIIGQGTIRRVIVNKNKFEMKTGQKLKVS
ncbi:MAG: thioesterase family protein [Desulfovibrio sp.]|nr:thioesterase family protein [Desulfovibrio sp.]